MDDSDPNNSDELKELTDQIVLLFLKIKELEARIERLETNAPRVKE